MKKPRIIIGVDPGTTAAVGVLDHTGKVISVFSGKDLGINELIAKITALGKPIVIGTDKAKVPSLINQISVKTGSICISPKEDLKVSEKRDLANSSSSNDHERDALASAYSAFNQIKNKLLRIQSYVEKNKKLHLHEKLIDYVICKELSLYESLSLLEDSKKPAVQIVQKVIEKKQLFEKDFLNLLRKLQNKEREIEFLKKQNSSLKKENSVLQKEIRKSPKRKPSKKQVNKLIDLKDRSIQFLGKTVKAKDKEIKKHDDEILELQKLIGNMDDVLILKRLKNLSKDEFEKNKDILQITKKDVLLIDDANVMSKDVLQELSEIEYIISKKKANKVVLSKFVVLSASELEAQEYDYFATVSRKEFNDLKSKKTNISKLVAEYQQERSHKIIKTN